jgi:hypothetical protein
MGKARVARCPDGTVLVVVAPMITRLSSLADDARALPMFARERIEDAGFLGKLLHKTKERTETLRGCAATWLRHGDVLVHDEGELVRYTDEGDVALRVKAPFANATEIQSAVEDAYILASGELYVLRGGGALERLPQGDDIDAFAVDPGKGIWLFRGSARELVSL